MVSLTPQQIPASTILTSSMAEAIEEWRMAEPRGVPTCINCNLFPVFTDTETGLKTATEGSSERNEKIS